MVREDLVEGAVSFLQDPSVASAPLEQRIAFLRSKNLTQDEIDASLTRVGQGSPSTNSQPPPVQYRQPPPQYNTYNQGYPPQWQQPPPEAKRDWRDYFIAATVMGGVGYAMYWTAKRYVYPLIAPPTPPQLEQDKKSVDESFDKAFALLDQLATDTAELKEAEASRKARLDTALGEVEAVITRMKQANEEREQEAKRMARELNEVREQIPKAIEKERETNENRLKDLNVEMKSLKTLVANRMQGGGAPAPQRATPSFSNQPQAQSGSGHVLGSGGPVNGTSTPQGSSTPSQETVPPTNGIPAAEKANSSTSPYAAGTSQERSTTPYSRLLGGKAAIPSWQLAAKKKSEEAKDGASTNGTASPVQNVNESGTVSEAAESQS